MPWDVRKRGDKFCVIKQGESTPVPGGCHDTREAAIKHQRALYASESVSTDVATLNGMDDKLWYFAGPNDWTSSNGTVTVTFSTAAPEVEDEEHEDTSEVMWEGVLGLEGSPTSDNRYLIPGEIGARELPLPFMVQTVTAEGHDGSEVAGRIEKIESIPITDFERREEFNLEEVRDEAVVLWAEGSFDGSPASDEARRLMENGAGVSLDLPHDRIALFDPETYEEIKEEIGLEEFLMGDFLTGIGGKIAGATIVTIGAFEEANVQMMGDKVLVASAYGFCIKPRNRALTAAAGPVKPPSAWFEDPQLRELTPLQITKEGRVFGHLADWDGCHIGFQGVCVPPFRSQSNYKFFNTGAIETADGELIPCGKIMFCREGNGHADLHLTSSEASEWYDDATKVGAFVRAGSDRFGTWLAGALRSDLNDLEIQHLRTHPPSGDWRPIKGGPSELIAAFAVPIGGFPIARDNRALVASANGEITAIISAPLTVGTEVGARRRRRQRIMLANRLETALGYKPNKRRRMRKAAMEAKKASGE